MHTIVLRRILTPVLAIVLGVIISGCGGDTEKKDHVDVGAQVAGLAGDADAKVNALAEIAKAGPDAKGVVDKVIPLLKDEDAIVRRTAAYALGSIGPAAKAAIPDLKAMLDTTDRDQMTAVGNAIRAIDPASAPAGRLENVSN